MNSHSEVAKLPTFWAGILENDLPRAYKAGMETCKQELTEALAQDRASQAGAGGVPEGWVIKHHECGAVYIEAEGYGSTILPPGVDDANGLEGALLRLLAIDLVTPTPAAEREVRNG